MSGLTVLAVPFLSAGAAALVALGATSATQSERLGLVLLGAVAFW